MASILLLTYMFPPAGGIGTPRALAYARYLPRQGCRLSVLAPTEPALRDRDPGLEKFVPADIAVHRAWNPEIPMSFRDRVWRHSAFSNGNSGGAKRGTRQWMTRPLRWMAQRVLFPDPQVLWLPFAFGKACPIIKNDAIDTVIVNMPPYSLLKVALRLKKRFPHLKIITDFRDEWLGYYLSQIDRPTQDKVRRASKLEAQAVKASTYVSTVTETWVERLRNRYPDEPTEKFICTPNGYDPELFRDFKPRLREDKKIVVTYFGTIHDNRIYSPENYLAAVESLPEPIRRQIETRFIGRIMGNARQLLQRSKANIKLAGFIPKEEGIKRLEETDFALLIATDASSHAGKLFDYFACGKPILALSPPGGEIDRLLRSTRMGWCADPWDLNAIRQMMLSAYLQFRQTSFPLNPDVEAVRRFSWPFIISRFAETVGIAREESPIADLQSVLEMRVGA
jgi:hypothetical protein